AAAGLADARDALAAPHEDVAGLRARLELDRRRAVAVVVKRIDVDLAAERRLDEAHRDLGQHVFALALEPLVALHVQHDVEVTGAAALRGLALAGEPQRLAVVDAGGHGDRERRGFGLRAATAAVGTRLLDRLALAAAMRTGRLHHEEALGVHDLTFAAARAAYVGLAAGRGAAAGARRARDVARDLDLLAHAPHRFGKCQLEIDA